MKLQFNKTYFAICIILLITEVLIAIYLKTGFIRHTFGDFLAVILMYCFFKSFLEVNSYKLALAVLLFSFGIEISQSFNILKLLHLENNKFISTVLGSTFNVSDLIAYTLGVITTLIIEFQLQKLCTK